MRKIYTLVVTIFISANIIFLHNVLAQDINPDSELSPIKETFDKKVIIWRFDDIYIAQTDIFINRFVKMTENVTMYGGYVGWGFISGHNETIMRGPPQNLTYKQENIDKFNTLTSDEKVTLWLHCWNHSWYTGKHGISVWEKDIEQQRDALNHTIWTFYNNFGYYPPFFSAGGHRGNVDTTVVLAEKDILLLYGNANYEPPDERLRYLTLPSSNTSVLFGLDYHSRDNIFEDMKAEFTNKYNNYLILQILLHPNGWNETTIPIFAEFTEWVYTNYDLINMNYTDAHNYKHDLESIILDKQNDAIYSLNFQDVFNPLEITWSEPGDWIVEYAHNHTRYGDLNVSSLSDTIILQPGYEYRIRSASSTINTIDDTNKDSSDSNDQDSSPISLTNITIILLIIAVIIYSLFKSVNKRR